MKKVLLPVILLIFIGCDKEFEPVLTGWQAYTVPFAKPLIHFKINGRETMIELPGNEKIGYRFAQWTKFPDRILLTQIVKTQHCFNYQIIAIDTTGTITDTLYTAPPNTAVNFKLAPNDSLLLLKTYDDNCDESDHFKYTFYNRYLKIALPDTIAVGNARGILLHETVWSPDSKKVIISEWSGQQTKAFTYDLLTKDRKSIDTGSDFIWSPSDNNLVAYIKNYSVYTKNIKTGEEELMYKGKRKKSVTDFRWNPHGDFLMIHIKSYLLNVEAEPLQRHTIIYLSMKDKRESAVFYRDHRIDTWKDAATNHLLMPTAADSLN